MNRRAILGGLMALALLAGSGAARAAPLVSGTPPTVFAAASLTDALRAVGQDYAARTGIAPRFSFASSSAVARQIEGGAAADIFFSADREWMDDVAAKGLLAPGTRRDVLRGRLALVAPRASSVALGIARGMPLAAALGPDGRLATGDPAYVPAGIYAKAALTSLGLWDQLAGRLARADNVRVALAYVAHGDAPLGIVYETDALAEPGVRIVGLFPEASHPPIVYPLALLRGARPEARGFYDYLRGPRARAIFRRFGFRPA